jgi:ribonucleoside-diphosphate reductase alpha chain
MKEELINIENLDLEEEIISSINLINDYTVDIEVEKDHHYILKNGIISHNSSILANMASGGLEPVFLFEYIRTVSQPFAPDGLSIPTNVDWVSQTYTQDGNQDWKWVKEGDENMLKSEFEKNIYKFDKSRGLLKESEVKDYGVRFLEQRGEWDPTADWAANISNLKINEHIETMKVISKYIDSSMSKTINLPNDYKYEDFKNVYIELYKSGTIKGGTTYRAGTMATVIKKKDEVEDTNTPPPENNVPKRPKILECDVLRFTNKGEKWIGFIGLNKDMPYEIFTGLADSFIIPNWVEKGMIRKEKIKSKDNELISRYDFIYTDKEGYEVIMTGLNRAFEREYWNIGKMTSALLRHHIHMPSVIRIIESLKLDGDVMGTWKKGMIRMLKKYVKDDSEKGDEACKGCGSHNLVYKEGCVNCLDCGWSKC